jgi:galactokinase
MGIPVIVSSPGRADFLNTHQDYKGLPVISVAINLRTYLSAQTLTENIFVIKSRNLERVNEPSTDLFKIQKNDILKKGFFGNYFRGIVNVLIKQNFVRKLQGMEITIDSEIPIGSGLASSAALEVAFVALLNYVNNLGYTKKSIAEIAFLSETEEVGIPCGRLDQYGVSYGGIIKLDCKPPYTVEQLPFKDLTFAIIDSGIRHSTAEIHPKRQAELDEGLMILMKSRGIPKTVKMKLGYRFDQPRWTEIREKEIAAFLSILDSKIARRILFTLRMQQLTDIAVKILRFEKLTKKNGIMNLGEEEWKRIQKSSLSERNYLVLGEVMNKQHTLLRDFYDVSLPEIEKLCSTALEIGAYGAKISGAGLGGSIIALVKDKKSGQEVIDVCLAEGARTGWVSVVSEGVKIEDSDDRISRREEA